MHGSTKSGFYCENFHPGGGKGPSKIYHTKSQWQAKVWHHQSSSWGTREIFRVIYRAWMILKQQHWKVGSQQRQQLPRGWQMEPLPLVLSGLSTVLPTWDHVWRVAGTQVGSCDASPAPSTTESKLSSSLAVGWSFAGRHRWTHRDGGGLA